jgi:predicted protein tyrosine phosphatase
LEVLEAEVLQLAPVERSHLLERLIASLDSDPNVEEAWEREADRREAELESGSISAVSGREAIARLRTRLFTCSNAPRRSSIPTQRMGTRSNYLLDPLQGFSTASLGRNACSVAMTQDTSKLKRVLFICSQNRLRSPTAEQVFSAYPGLECSSAGLNHDAEYPVTPELLEWAEIIFVMEKAHRNKLSSKFKRHLGKARIVCLDIPDDYEFMDPVLVRLLKIKVARHLPHGHTAA